MKILQLHEKIEDFLQEKSLKNPHKKVRCTLALNAPIGFARVILLTR